MSTSGDLNKILNQLLIENKTLRLLILGLLRDRPVSDLNSYIEQAEIRTKLAIQNELDPEGANNLKVSGDSAVSLLKTLIAEKSASL